MSFIKKPRTDIINDMLIKIVDNVREISDVNPGSVIRTLIEALATEVDLTYEELQSIYDGTRVLTASGSDLDNLGEIVGIKRTTGSKSSGIITFSRETISNNPFTILPGTLVSTNPAEGDQITFVVNEEISFRETINENVLYKDGIYNYPLSERLIGLISSVTGFTDGTDYQVAKINGEYLPDSNSLVVIDNCDSITGWSENSEAIAASLTTLNTREGTGMLNLGKSGTGSNEIYYFKTFSPLNLLDLRTFLFLNIDNSELNKINEVKLRLSSDNNSENNYYEMTLQNLKSGFNLYNVFYSDFSEVGFPNIESIKSVRFIVTTNNNSDTIILGNIQMDFIHASKSEQPYYGDVIEWLYLGNRPADSVNFNVEWKPLSVDSEIFSTEIGENQNVGANKITYKVNLIPNISSVNNYYSFSSGTNIETDNNLRDRIRGAAFQAGKATVEAIKQTLLGINGLQSVNVNDLPLRNIYGPSGNNRTSEDHIMNVTTGRTRLNFDILNLDNFVNPTNIIISDDHDDNIEDYTYGRNNDYYYDEDLRELIWDTTNPGTTCPNNGDTFYVGYQVNLLGHVQIYVAGFASPLSSVITSKINEVIESVKAAGITVTWQEATFIRINVTCLITIQENEGYNSESVRQQVRAKLINWLNGKNVGDNVLVAEFYEQAMNVAGVFNVMLTNWNSDTSAPFQDITIGFNQVARPEDGGIIVN